MADSVDRIVDQWATARPDVDTSAMGIIGRLSRITRIMERQLQVVYTRHGLQAGEFDILATLYRNQAGPRGLTPGELTGSAMVTSGAITNRLDRLVAKDLITREVDPANRRTVRIALTELGQQTIGDALTDHVANEELLLAGMPEPRRTQLESLLRSLLTDYEGTKEKERDSP